MRAARFASQLNFDIAPDTFEALMAHKDRLDIVSLERGAEELNQIILSRSDAGSPCCFPAQLRHCARHLRGPHGAQRPAGYCVDGAGRRRAEQDYSFQIGCGQPVLLPSSTSTLRPTPSRPSWRTKTGWILCRWSGSPKS